MSRENSGYSNTRSHNYKVLTCAQEKWVISLIYFRISHNTLHNTYYIIVGVLKVPEERKVQRASSNRRRAFLRSMQKVAWFGNDKLRYVINLYSSREKCRLLVSRDSKQSKQQQNCSKLIIFFLLRDVYVIWYLLFPWFTSE